MPKAALILSIFCTGLMLISMVPFLGWLNWFNMPLLFISLGFSIAGLSIGWKDSKQRSFSIAALILACVSIGFGGFRWLLGGFIL
jgi:hypothetical protein